jgi:hypothetical protein
MESLYQVCFFCHGCGLENTFTFSCSDDYFEAVQKAATILCPSGCNPRRAIFELTRLFVVEWEAAVGAADAVFH